MQGLEYAYVNAGSGANIDILGKSSTIAQSLIHGTGTPDGGLTLRDSVGGGMLTLTGNNTYSGSTTISSGTLAIGGSGYLGTGGNYNGNIANSSALLVNTSSPQTFSGTITGNGTLYQAGNSTLTLAASNGYSGSTTLTGNGVVAVTNGGAPGLRHAQSAVHGGRPHGYLPAFRRHQRAQRDRRQHDDRPRGHFEPSGNNTFSGPLTLTGASGNIFIVSNGGASGSTFALTNSISGGSGYTGNFSFRGTSGALGSVSAQITLPGATIDNNGGTNWTISSTGNSWKTTEFLTAGYFVLGANNALATGAPLWWSSTGATGGLDLAGYNQSVAGLTTIAGGTAGTITNNSASSPSTLTLNGATANDTYGGTITNGTGGKAVALVMNSSGEIQTLSGSDNYSGGTTISAGTLQLGNAAALGSTSGSLNVNGGALDLNGYSPTVAALSGGSNGLVFSSSPASVTLTSAPATGAATYAGVLSNGNGTLGLTLNGSGGLLALAGLNTYSGSTTITAGTLALVGVGNLGDNNGDNYAQPISNAGTLLVNLSSGNNQTFSGAISGAGALTQAGAGIETLTGSNTYSGNTTVSNGTLNISGGGYLYSASNANTATISVASGAALIVSSTYGSYNPLGYGNSEVWNVSGLLSVTGTAVQTLPGGVTLSGGTLAAPTTGAGGTSGFGAFAVTANKTINATGNSFITGGSNAISISNGTTLTLSPSSATDSLTVTGNIVNQNGQTTGALAKSGSGLVTLSGNNTYGGSTTITAGTLALGGGGNLGQNQNYAANIANSGVLVISTSDAQTFSGAITGAGSFVQAGNGLTVLSASNGYTGGTTISGGTLRTANLAALGTSSSSTLSISSGGLLDLYGKSLTISSLATSTGTITDTSAGPSSGTLTIATPTNGIGTLISDNGSAKIVVVANNNNGSALTTNVNNNFSGGLVMTQSSGTTCGCADRPADGVELHLLERRARQWAVWHWSAQPRHQEHGQGVPLLQRRQPDDPQQYYCQHRHGHRPRAIPYRQHGRDDHRQHPAQSDHRVRHQWQWNDYALRGDFGQPGNYGRNRLRRYPRFGCDAHPQQHHRHPQQLHGQHQREGARHPSAWRQ